MDKQMYKQLIAEYMRREAELKEKIMELETELYFCKRNNKIDKEVNGR